MTLALATGPALALAGVAWANDSSAVLGADGLMLTQAASVTMESEDLYIGRNEVRVRYVFRNVSAEPVETVVAFPLPDIDLRELSEVPVDQPSDDPVNFVDFRVSVDGTPVVPQVEQRAFLDGKEVTEELRRRKLPMTMFEPDYWERLMAVPKPERRALEAEALAFFEDQYEGAYPQWLTRTSFYWPQSFPPGRPVVIEHSYKPVVGQSFFGQYSFEAEEGTRNRETFCIDESTERAIRKKLDQVTTPDQPGYLLAYWVRYVLKTGANWSGPIGRFHLTVDKGKPTAIVSLCADGVRKTGPTTFEIEKMNYTPDRDVDILILDEVEAE